jgi:hypothetical protein
LKADRQRLACRSGQSGPSELNTHLAYAEAVENAINTKAQILAVRSHSDIVPVAMGVLSQIANSLEALPQGCCLSCSDEDATVHGACNFYPD